MDWETDFADFVTTDIGAKENKPGVRQYSDRTTFLRTDVKLYRPAENLKSQVRVIPNPSNKHWAKQVSIHYGIGLGKHSCGCLIMKGVENCPACIQSRKCYAAGNKEGGANFKAKPYWLLWGVDRQNESEGVQVWQIPNSTYDKIFPWTSNPKTGAIVPLFDPRAGRDLFFTRRKDNNSDFVTVCDLALDPDPSPLGTAEQMIEWLSYVKDHSPIESLMVFFEAKKMVDMIQGFDSEMPDNESSDDFDPGSAWDTAVANAPSATLEVPVTEAPKPAAGVNQPDPATAEASAVAGAPSTSSGMASAPSKGPVDMEALRAKLAGRTQG